MVGNLVVGGAGKTPRCIALVRRLRAAGWRPGVVSRGYGRRGDACRAVQRRDSAGATVGDEPLLIRRAHRRARCGSARGRVAAARALLRRASRAST